MTTFLSSNTHKILNLRRWGAECGPFRQKTINPQSTIFNKIIEEKFELASAIGYVRGTKVPYPLDIKTLCFSNTLLIAGIGHGKSHTARILAIVASLLGANIVVIDPTGEWRNLKDKLREAFRELLGNFKVIKN